jgi:hypothetical protein
MVTDRLPSSHCFLDRPVQPLYILMDPIDGYLKRVEPFSHTHDMKMTDCLLLLLILALLSSFSLGLIITRSVLLFLFLLAFRTAAFSTTMRKRKVTAEELLARADSNSYQGDLAERKTTLETARGTWARPRRIKTRRRVAISYKRSVSMLLTCTKVNILRNAKKKSSLQQGPPALGEANTGHHSSHRQGRSQSGNRKGIPPLLHRCEPWQDCRENHGRFNTRNGSSTETYIPKAILQKRW